MSHVIFGGPISVFNDTWVAKDDRVGGDINIHVTVWGNKNIITDCYFSHDCGVNAYPNLVAYCRGTSAKPSVRLSDDDSLVDIAIPANAGVGINGDIIVMAYIYPPN